MLVPAYDTRAIAQGEVGVEEVAEIQGGALQIQCKKEDAYSNCHQKLLQQSHEEKYIKIQGAQSFSIYLLQGHVVIKG
jgi:hypothetical protein